MTKFYLNLMNSLAERKEEGQGTVEYVGIAVVITVIIAGVVTALSNDSTIGRAVRDTIDSVIGDIAEGLANS